MKSERFLGELASELQLRLGQRRTAELVEELAAHLSASGASPIEEFGQPSTLAAQLVAAERPSVAGVVIKTALGVFGMFLLLIGFQLVFSGNIEGSDLAQQGGIAVVFGGLSQLLGGRVRTAVRQRSPWSVLVYVALVAVFLGAVEFVPVADTAFAVPNRGFVAAALVVAGMGLLTISYRPVRFRAGSNLRTNPITGRINVR